jgi:L,D-peptidoglycan transpeptidase YkuD (ErfK/YbiS/YcfS/YnhG family)
LPRELCIDSNTLVVEPRDAPVLYWNGGSARCAIGRGGIARKQCEGDGITPIGIFPIRRILSRPDRVERPQTALPVSALQQDDGWCDAPGDPNYNRAIKLPYPKSAESMWRDDRLYDVVAILGFNDDPVVDGAGSAIFLHCARDDYGPTEGCVALRLADLLDAVSALTPGATIEVRDKPSP